MANMGYVRFENTLRDLRECYEHLDDDLSEEEGNACVKLIELCQLIDNEYGDNNGRLHKI